DDAAERALKESADRIQAIDALAAAVETRLDEAQNGISLLATQSKDIEASITETLGTQSTAFAKMLASLQASFTAELDSHKEQLATQLSEAKKETGVVSAQLEEMAAEGSTLLGKMSERAISRDYATYAKNQGWAAVAWTLLAAAVATFSLWFVW